MHFGDMLMRKWDFLNGPTNGDKTEAFITEKNTCILSKWEEK